MTEWIEYYGADRVFGDNGEALASDHPLFVVGKIGGKLNAKRMTVAEMVAARDIEDYPVAYRADAVAEPAAAPVLRMLKKRRG